MSETKVYEVFTDEASLRDISTGKLGGFVFPTDAGGVTPIRCILMPVGDNGFVPGDRVRWQDKLNHDDITGTVRGTRSDGAVILEPDAPHAPNLWCRPAYHLTPIEPAPERTSELRAIERLLNDARSVAGEGAKHAERYELANRKAGEALDRMRKLLARLEGSDGE